jgi:hypothetical protein
MSRSHLSLTRDKFIIYSFLVSTLFENIFYSKLLKNPSVKKFIKGLLNLPSSSLTKNTPMVGVEPPNEVQVNIINEVLLGVI